MFRILGICLLFVALLISACGQRSIVGSGTVIEETRQVSDFERVVVCCGMDLIFSQGDGPELQLEGEDNLLAEISNEINQGTLNISYKDPNLDKYLPTKPIRVIATTDTVRGLRVSGGGKLEAEGLTSDNLEIALSGGSEGSIRSIIADTLQLAVAGNGNMSLGNSEVEEMALELSGGSDTQISTVVAKKLTGNASGGGEIAVQNLLVEQLELELAGGSRAKADEFSGETLELIINGGGNATLAGDINEQHIQLTGGSSYLAPDLRSRNANIQGNGDAVIWVTEILDVALRGYARVEYFGTPVVDQRLSGSSEVVPLGIR